MAPRDTWIEMGWQWLADHRRSVGQCFTCALILAAASWCYNSTIDTAVQGQPADLEKLASSATAERKDRKGKSEMVYDAGKNRRAVSLGNPFTLALPLTTEAVAVSVLAENGLPITATRDNYGVVTPSSSSQMPMVTGVMGSEGQWVAVLSVAGNSRVYRTGERLEAYTVGHISDQTVELCKDGKTITLAIGGGMGQ